MKASGKIFPGRAVQKQGRSRPTVMAIHFPAWHRYDHMDSWKGEGWNEWQLIKKSQPRFPGHYQPLKPSWGAFDESDPKWTSKEIHLAADHGVDVFLFDWYWYSGVKIMEEALERGFLASPNRQRLRFALMWANHDWADYFPAPYQKPWNQWLPSRHSAADLDRAIDYCAEHYFAQPNYWRLNEQLFFSVFQPERLVDEVGGAEKTKRALQKLDRKLKARGLPALHWNAMVWDAKPVTRLKAAGFQSVTSYTVNSTGASFNVDATGKTTRRDKGLQQYSDLIKAHHRNWDALSQSGLSHFPVATLGWDVTPRCLKEVSWPFSPEAAYPYTHVVVGNTPRRFGQLCRDALQHLKQRPSATENVVMVNAWNEWTEGCYLLPEKRYGDGYLRVLRDVFGCASGQKKRVR